MWHSMMPDILGAALTRVGNAKAVCIAETMLRSGDGHMGGSMPTEDGGLVLTFELLDGSKELDFVLSHDGDLIYFSAAQDSKCIAGHVTEFEGISNLRAWLVDDEKELNTIGLAIGSKATA